MSIQDLVWEYRSLYFIVSEILADHSKSHLSAEEALDLIRQKLSSKNTRKTYDAVMDVILGKCESIEKKRQTDA